ncbi:hypothetical protein AAMO2058_000693900 [Amorphochlora amoebiformis]
MSKKKVLAKIRELQKLPGNDKCTDCGSEDVSWAVLNHGFLICVKCAGVHRGLGVQYSQVRSTELDVDCWDEKTFAEFEAKGNSRAQKIFEANVPKYYLSPRECMNDLVRKNWIETKYLEKAFRASETTLINVRMPERALVRWLHKRNDSGKWQKRYCILFHDTLSYFTNSSTSLPSGTINISNSSVKITDRKLGEKCEYGRFKFQITCESNRTYTLSAMTGTELFQWIHALRRASIFYSERKGEQSAKRVNEKKVEYQAIKKDIKHEGLLAKAGGSFMTWKTRWCVLTWDAMYYFKSSKEPKTRDVSAGVTRVCSLPVLLETLIVPNVGIDLSQYKR